MTSLKAPLLPDWELSPRWTARARSTSSAAEAAAARPVRCVQFCLGGGRLALALDSVERVLPKLGPLTRFVGEANLAGIALERGQPLLVVDLEDAQRDEHTSLAPIEERPALVVPFAGGRVAVAVSGPADLVEAPVEARPLSGHGILSVEGFVDRTIPLLSMGSVRAWLVSRLGSAS